MIINASDLDRVRQAELARGVILAMQDDQESQQPRHRLAARLVREGIAAKEDLFFVIVLRVAAPFGRRKPTSTRPRFAF